MRAAAAVLRAVTSARRRRPVAGVRPMYPVAPSRRLPLRLVLALLLAASVLRAGEARACFTLEFFPIAGATADTARIGSVLDHSGAFFYTGCCDTSVVAFTGETAHREDGAIGCPEPAGSPGCLFANCQCVYAGPDDEPFSLDGLHTGYFGNTTLSYDGHAGYDFDYPGGTAILATRDGTLCKALLDPVNGFFGAANAWERFHTFYIDHGVVSGQGYASWYLHANDLEGDALRGLVPGGCAPVTAGQVVARVGNAGTFLPHLHFEVRVRPAGAGVASSDERVFDPYGWSGAGADPFSLPGGNRQAVSRVDPVWLPEPGAAHGVAVALCTLCGLRRRR